MNIYIHIYIYFRYNILCLRKSYVSIVNFHRKLDDFYLFLRILSVHVYFFNISMEEEHTFSNIQIFCRKKNIRWDCVPVFIYQFFQIQNFNRQNHCVCWDIQIDFDYFAFLPSFPDKCKLFSLLTKRFQLKIYCHHNFVKTVFLRIFYELNKTRKML